MSEKRGQAQEQAQALRVVRMLRRCRTLGPGERVVIWVGGCSRRCPGCIAEPILSPEAGTLVTVEALAERILGWEDAHALTLSGGEPFEQAEALVELCQRLRQARDFSLMSYSGYRRSELERSAVPARRELLGMLDILVDGPFIVSQQQELLWRGSGNQTVHLMTERHRSLAATLDGASVGVELHVDDQGGVFWAGIPPAAFHERLVRGLSARGIDLIDVPGGFA